LVALESPKLRFAAYNPDVKTYFVLAVVGDEGGVEGSMLV
jgi:hypothetical protein